MDSLPTPTRTITVHRRLRPVRLAFLVGATDGDGLQRVLEINASLWGGRFNGIVPILNRVPRRLADRGLGPSRDDFVRGHLRAFEPDYVVETASGQASGLGVENERVLKLEDVYSTGTVGTGLSVENLYRKLHETEFRFVRRSPETVLVPRSHAGLQLLVSAALGLFPGDGGIERQYRKFFDASELELGLDNFLEPYLQPFGMPLRLGSRRLQVRGVSAIDGPTLFLLDAQRPFDVIQFWNLRALGRYVVPVPRTAVPELASACGTLIKEWYRVNPRNTAWTVRTGLLAAASVSERELDDFAALIAVEVTNADAFYKTRHYPRLWHDQARKWDRVERCQLSAEESDEQVVLVERRAQITSLSPDFAPPFPEGLRSAWINVLQLRDYTHPRDLPTVLPPGLPGARRLFGMFFADVLTVSSEGIILGRRNGSGREVLSIPMPEEVFEAWLQGKGLKVSQSGAGKIASALWDALGSWGWHFIANLEILKKLDEMAHGLVEEPSDAPDTRKPKARGRTILKKTLLDLLKRVNRNDELIARGQLRGLLARGVIQVGLKVKCPNCNQSNWYPLEGMSAVLQCGTCLGSYRFPESEPDEAKWAYRSRGAFAVENFAQGNYTVVLTVGFLTRLRAEATWMPGICLQKSDGTEAEADFAMWWGLSDADPYSPRFVVGECKSLGEGFSEERAEKFTKLSKLVPGATLVFATLLPSLSDEQRKWLTRFILGERKKRVTGKPWSEVLVLTSVELLARLPPPECWRDAGGRVAELAKDIRPWTDLPDLCAATQRIHLEIEAEEVWWERERQRRLERRARRVSRA